MKKYETNILLLSVVFCWAAAYVFIETASEVLSPFGYLATINGIAAVLLILAFLPRLLRTTMPEFLHGVILGSVMTGVLLAEYAGVKLTNSSTASLLSSLDLVVVPFLLLFLGKVPKKNQIAGILLILAGTVLSHKLSGSGNHIAGIFFMALDGVLMAFYNVFSNRFCEKDDPVILATVQLFFMALVSLCLWYREDPAVFFGVAWTRKLVSAVLVLGFFSKAFAYIVLMYGEHYADPIDVVVIFALEPIITMIFAACIPDSFGGAETAVTRNGLICAAVIIAGSIIAGMEPEELRELWRRILCLFRSRRRAEKTAAALPETGAADSGEEAEPCRRTAGTWSPGQSFVKVFVTFVLLGGSFKVMTLIPGYTEIRPVNGAALPAGLLFGLPGAAACGLGNLAADLFGTLKDTSVLGILVTFLQAFIPYRLWGLYGEGGPDIHTRRNLAAYIFLTFAGALSCAWSLEYGIFYFSHTWIPRLLQYIFLNSLFFPLLLGLPVFVILTSSSVRLVPAPALPWILPLSGPLRRGLFAAHLMIAAAFAVLTVLGITPASGGNIFFPAASFLAVLLLGAALL